MVFRLCGRGDRGQGASVEPALESDDFAFRIREPLTCIAYGQA